MSSSDQINNNATSTRKRIVRFILGSIVLGIIINLSAFCLYLLSNQQNPLSAPPDGLREDPVVMTKLKEMVDIYKKRIKGGMKQEESTEIFRQQTLDAFKAFIQENNDTDTALTARLIVAEQPFMYAKISDKEFSNKILQELAKDYPERWQGKIAETYLLARKLSETDSGQEKPEHLIIIKNEFAKLLETFICLGCRSAITANNTIFIVVDSFIAYRVK